MEDNMTYYEHLFARSEEEERIDAELDAERKRFEETEAYKEHQENLTNLLDELKVAGEKRRAEAKKARQEKAKQNTGKSTSSKSTNLRGALTQSQRNDSIRTANQSGRKINKSSADND